MMRARIPADHSMRDDALAEAIGAPRNYLAKTLNALAKSGILHSARGTSGGFSLAIAPQDLTIARVTQLFDERPRTGVCLLSKRACDATNPCAAHVTWTNITASALQAIEHTTIADLLGTGEYGSGAPVPIQSRPRVTARRRQNMPPLVQLAS